MVDCSTFPTISKSTIDFWRKTDINVIKKSKLFDIKNVGRMRLAYLKTFDEGVAPWSCFKDPPEFILHLKTSIRIRSENTQSKFLNCQQPLLLPIGFPVTSHIRPQLWRNLSLSEVFKIGISAIARICRSPTRKSFYYRLIYFNVVPLVYDVACCQ